MTEAANDEVFLPLVDDPDALRLIEYLECLEWVTAIKEELPRADDER